MREGGQEGSSTGGDAGWERQRKKGSMTGMMQDRKNERQKECRPGGNRTGIMQDLVYPGQERCRAGMMQDRRNAGMIQD